MNWTVKAEAKSLFPSLEATLDVKGEVINSNWMSALVYVEHNGRGYYVKLYRSRGRGLRRFLGRSRCRAEWENLQAFHRMGIPSAEVVAFGERLAGDYAGALVTEEVRGTRDLASLVEENAPLLTDRQWRRHVIRRLAAVVREMHDQGFIHTDLKWRNILVEPTPDPRVYVIDCPLGRQMFGPFLARGRVKDLACLDKVGSRQLSRTDRLRFYLLYSGRPGPVGRLMPGDKKEIRRILAFFSGRD